MHVKLAFCCVLVLQLAACVAPTESTIAAVDYRTIVARSLGYYPETEDTKHYSISEPWRPMVGQLMVCVREDVPDGKGGFAPTTNFSMYQFDDGKIKGMIKDSTLFGCPNRQYSELPRSPRAN